MEGSDILEGEHRAETVRTVNSFVIPAPGFALKACAAMFGKLVLGPRSLKLLLKFAVLFFRAGEFLLQAYVALFERCDSVSKEFEAFLENGRGPAFNDELIDHLKKAGHWRN
jgi:hypothetical protein